MIRLGDLVTLQGGGTPPRNNSFFWNGDIPWASVKDLTSARLTSTKEYISPAGVRASATNVVLAGNVVVATRMAVGRASILEIDAAINQDLKALIPRARNKIHPPYLIYLLAASADYLESRATGTTVKGIRGEVLEDLPVPHPVYADQVRIANILDRADAIRRKRKEAIALAQKLLRSTFLEMFGDPVNNPKRWPVQSLNDFISKDRPITYGILKPGPDIAGGVPYVRVVDIKGGMVNTTDVRRTAPVIDHEYRRSRLRPGDLLMSIRGHVGRLAIVPSELDGANITQDTARIAPIGLEPTYLMNLLETEAIQFWMSKHIRGVAVRGINIGDVRRIPVPVPPPKLQSRFAGFAETIARECRSARSALVAAEDLSSSLMTREFSNHLSGEGGLC